MGESKILVEIIPTNRVLKRKKLVVDGNSVVVKKGKRGRGSPPYKATFDESSIIYYYVGFGPFKRLKQKLMLKDGSQKCMQFLTDEVEGLTRGDVKNLFDVTGIKYAGMTVQKVQIPTVLYILLFMALVFGLINLVMNFRMVGYFGF